MDNLVGVGSLILNADGAVLLFLSFRHLLAGVLGADVEPNKAIHLILALCAAATMDILCAKLGVLTASADGELKNSSSSPSVGGFE